MIVGFGCINECAICKCQRQDANNSLQVTKKERHTVEDVTARCKWAEDDEEREGKRSRKVKAIVDMIA